MAKPRSWWFVKLGFICYSLEYCVFGRTHWLHYSGALVGLYFESTTSLPEGPMCLASRPGCGSHVEVDLNGSTVEVNVVVLPYRVEVCHNVHGYQADPTGHQMHPQGVEHVPNGLLSENAC